MQQEETLDNKEKGCREYVGTGSEFDPNDPTCWEEYWDDVADRSAFDPNF